MLKAFVMEIILFGTFSLRSQAGHINRRKQNKTNKKTNKKNLKRKTEHDQIFENTQSFEVFVCNLQQIAF